MLRDILLRHRMLAVWLAVLALLMKVAVPAGYMIGTEHGSITIELCSGTGPMTMTMQMPGMAHHDNKSDHGKGEQPCPFSGLSAPSLAAADPILLAIAITFIVATVFRIPDKSVVRAPAFLRPPLRGPPALS
jgi:hypothetical protein